MDFLKKVSLCSENTWLWIRSCTCDPIYTSNNAVCVLSFKNVFFTVSQVVSLGDFVFCLMWPVFPCEEIFFSDYKQ